MLTLITSIINKQLQGKVALCSDTYNPQSSSESRGPVA